MKKLFIIALLACTLQSEAQLPPSGTYTYKLCYNEWYGCVNTCTVIINKDTVTVISDEDISVPKGEIIDKGILMQHRSGKWIIGQKPGDRNAPKIGGCGQGPSVIDFGKKRFRSC